MNKIAPGRVCRPDLQATEVCAYVESCILQILTTDLDESSVPTTETCCLRSSQIVSTFFTSFLRRRYRDVELATEGGPAGSILKETRAKTPWFDRRDGTAAASASRSNAVDGC